ncbi:class I SAM-dependent methyltransferase [Micromonosporaceae bacterium Da 78-11]
MHDDAHWAAYNARQPGRPVRELCRRAMDLAGPGAGRTAIDLGCGAGVETRALLDAGWRVLAVDGEPGTPARLLRTIGGRHDRLTVRTGHFAEVADLPTADLIYAGYALPYQNRDSFDRLWTLIRAAQRGVLAVNLFGERDAWAGEPSMTFLTSAEVRARTAGLSVEHWHEEDEVGPAFSGPKHWHVFDLVVRSGPG